MANNNDQIERTFVDYISKPRWVEWRDEDGNKVPCKPGTSRRASHSEANDWNTFNKCRGERRGIVFNGDGLWGFDLDACRNPDSGELAGWAHNIIHGFNSYAEVSPSGTGVKIFALGGPAEVDQHVYYMPGEPVNGKHPQVEVYSTTRYFTVTGNKLPDAADQIGEVSPQAALAQLQLLSLNKSKERKHKETAGRHSALFSLACRLQAQGKSDDEIHGAVNAANVTGNVDLHANFAEGSLPEREVVKVIRSALKYEKGVSEEDQFARLNREYCVVSDGGKVRILQFKQHVQIKDGAVVHTRLVPTYYSFADFNNYFKNEYIINSDGKRVSLGNWWTCHKERRTYCGLTFRPDLPDSEVGGELNLWRGWGVEPGPGDWSLMRQHIREVIAAGDDEADSYIINWLAWMVQHPDQRAEVALVLKGGRGVGKGALGNAMVRIFGQHACHISSVDHLAGHFNAHLRDTCFLFADEAYWPGDKAAEGTLKRLITEPTLAIEAKGRDVVFVPNMLHVLMASNEDWVVPAGEHERRYVVFQTSEHKRQDQSWFKPLFEQLEDGGYAAMLHDLLNHELGDWHPRDIPMTEALREQQKRNLNPLDGWLLKLFEDGVLPEGLGVNRLDVALSRTKSDLEGRNPRNGLYDLARENPALRYVDEQVLASHLKKFGCIPWRSSQERGWAFPPLAQCRAKWEEKYPDWKWQHPELTEWQQDDNTGWGTHIHKRDY